MKFCILVTEYTGCFYWRIRVPFLALAERGHQVRMSDGKVEVSSDEILVVQRNALEVVLNGINTHRSFGGKVVFEIDDDLHALPPSNPSQPFYRHGSYGLAMIEQQMRLASMLIVSTPRLAERYREFNPNIHVCYNAADPEDIAPYLADGEPEEDGTIRIGWGGSDTHIPDFSTIVEPLTKVMRERPQVRFVFIGGDMRNMFPSDVRTRMRHAGGTGGGSIKNPPSLGFMKLIAQQRLHIAIAPIAPLAFNASKSWCKLVEFGALGIPLVASRFGPYLEYGRNQPEEVVILAEGRKEWERGLLRLIDSKEERETLRRRNRLNVLAKHLSTQRVVEWEKAFATLEDPVLA